MAHVLLESLAPITFSFFLVIPPPPRSTLFPYTTLFRSRRRCRRRSRPASTARASRGSFASPARSEEHTSELQSRQYLVCRLPLEKKKNQDLKEHRHMDATAPERGRPARPARDQMTALHS